MPCLLLLSACKGGGGAGEAQAKPGEEKKGPDAVPVEVAKASRRAVAASYTGTAPLEPVAESQVVAKTSGVALNVMFEEGQQVRAGQTLVRLDSARSELQAAQTAAQMRKLEANYARAKQMAEQKLLSANDNDQLRYDLEEARAANRMANLELSYASVEAPISGVIASRSIKTGNFVQINTPIFRIVDTSRLEATLNVPERELATLKSGLPVLLQVDALPGKTFAGTVDRVAPVVDSGSGTFRVVCSFAGGGVLQPGMFGRIKIDYDQRANALVVPRVALLEDDGDPAVFVVNGDKTKRVPVKLGYMDGSWAEVREGVKEGDQVVVAGKTALRDGTVVQVLGQPQAKAEVAAVAKTESKQ
ncbi:efflux RND transporter periplasmic adaptor subunit [Lysobacter panacisoli]|uniref:Efflux RND transporter periplasmic adaptor subunit n=1 Tax=Lysobacter panacisoli TaxID=1255263 RepID=A0ABP9LBT2_9GAMM